jgi:hypothetical protein
MKSHLFFLAATVAALLIFPATSAQELPTVLHAMWLKGTQVDYAPLLAVVFLLSSTLAVGRTAAPVRARARR